MSDKAPATNLIDRMFKAGAHFGFSKSRRHPSVAPYLFGSKQGFDIFDLEKTSALLEDAVAYVKQAGAEGKRVLFVGTKEEVADLVRTEAKRAGVSFAVNRWVGGTITNFPQIKKRIEHLLTLRKDQDSGELDRKYTKKERLMLSRDMERLEVNFEGILEMEQTPQLLVVVDPRHEAIAVTEARQAGIPVVAIMSSDCDVRLVQKPVVVNDAHRQSIALALGDLVDAYLEGKASFVPKTPQPIAK
jgi:small subunit ribosomal protein S2